MKASHNAYRYVCNVDHQTDKGMSDLSLGAYVDHFKGNETETDGSEG